ncbi:MAG: hypothetical protein ACLU9S_12840 [Oscillospiraceae bacterium]
MPRGLWWSAENEIRAFVAAGVLDARRAAGPPGQAGHVSRRIITARRKKRGAAQTRPRPTEVIARRRRAGNFRSPGVKRDGEEAQPAAPPFITSTLQQEASRS